MTEIDPYKVMKDRIGIAIVALVIILISCVLIAGCTPLPGYSIIDLRSEVMQPTFSMYRDPQVQLDIGTIIIWESLHSSEEKTRWDSTQEAYIFLCRGTHDQ